VPPPEAGGEELTGDDRRDHPARKDAAIDEHDENGEDEDLVRDRIEERAHRGGAA
jgi:hypothetical protein